MCGIRKGTKKKDEETRKSVRGRKSSVNGWRQKN